jgi:hypothetical protein
MPFALWPLRFIIFVMRHALWSLRFCKIALCSALCALLFLCLSPGVVESQGIPQGISGFLEFDYTFVSRKTTDAFGNTTKTEAQNYLPRFRLNIDTKIYPNLKLHAGALVEGIITNIKQNETEADTAVRRIQPYIDLTLDNRLYKVGVGYIRRDEAVKTSGIPRTTLINDEYYSNLGWRPEAFPSIDMIIKKTKTYDEKKSVVDITEDYYNLQSRYDYRGLQLYYNGTYLDTQRDLINLETWQQTHSGWVNYSNAFFDKRVFLNTTYQILYQDTKTRSEGKGTVSSQIFPFAGLMALDNTPADGALFSDVAPGRNPPALIDGDFVNSVGADYNLIVDLPLPAGDSVRNFGLDLLNVTEVNSLFVWVNTDVSSIASSFSWQIWISSDNLNWTLHQAIPSAPFGTFQNRFELTFSNVSTRYIKVVTTPLAPKPISFAGTDVFVTELQAFINRPAEDVEDRVRSTSHSYNLDGKARLLDNPSLFYELYFFYNRLDPSSLMRYNLSNGFSVNHRFNPVLSGMARVAVENGEERDKNRLAFIGNASLTAEPLRTLRHSLVFYGRREEFGGRPNNLYYLTLYNNAQLYQGIDVNLSGGVNYSELETREKRTDYSVSLGANVVPHPTLTLGVTASDIFSNYRGGERGSDSTSNWLIDFNVSFTPLRTLYLYAFIQLTDQKGSDLERTQNFGINWSPFPDGALQFNFTYNEDFRSTYHQRERTFLPNVRWYFTKRSYVRFSYEFIRSRSDIQKLDSGTFSTGIKIFY